MVKLKIKEKPEDFIVREIPKLEFVKGFADRTGASDERRCLSGRKADRKSATSGDKEAKQREYVYFWLKKRNYTTIRAIQAISRALRVSKKRIGFAGNKDKNAITKQVISIWRVPKENVERLRLKDIELEYIDSGEERICLGDLKGNQFEIIVRGKYDKETVLQRVKEVEKGFPNYFGEQRFGVAGNTHLIGKGIVKGDFEKAVKELLLKGKKDPNWKDWKAMIKNTPKYQSMEKAILNWLINYPNDFAGAIRVLPKNTRRIFVHAYQSWFWNKALEKSKKVKKELPIPGYETKLGRDEFSKNIRELIKKDKITLQDFKCKRMPELASLGEFRKSFIKPQKLKVVTDKDMIKLCFNLEKGVYATTLLKEIFGEKLE